MPAAAWEISSAEETNILNQLKSIMPPGWSITRTARHSSPYDWLTFDEVGLRVEAQKGQSRFFTWFLPRDWIGIRKSDANWKQVGSFWHGIHLGAKYKVITDCPEERFHEALWRQQGTEPRLDNGGVFKNQLEEADRTSRQLVDRFCPDQRSRDEAAYSLVTLGVPAKTVIQQCALEGAGRAREACVWALHYFKNTDSLYALCKVLNDTNSSADCQKYAAMALERRADPAAVPALLAALDHVIFSEAVTHVAAALERLHRVEAAPMILKRMDDEPNPHYKVAFAKALASLRYARALPAIEMLCQTKRLTADWALDVGKRQYPGWVPEIALLRLTGSWGRPADGVRMLLLPPEKPVAGPSLKIALLVENASEKDLTVIGYFIGRLFINAKEYQIGPTTWDGNADLRVNDVWIYPLDLSTMIQQPGKYHVHYEAQKARSNALTLQVAPAE